MDTKDKIPVIRKREKYSHEMYIKYKKSIRKSQKKYYLKNRDKLREYYRNYRRIQREKKKAEE